MPVGAAVGGAAAGSLISADAQRSAANKAAGAQAKASKESIAFQREVDAKNRAEAKPWLDAGQWAIKNLQEGVANGDFNFEAFETDYLLNPEMFASGEFQGSRLNSGDYDQGAYNAESFNPDIDVTQDPSYQFRLNQGVNALDKSAAGRGKLFSGQQAKAVSQYGQEMASQEYQNAYNRSMAANQQNNALQAQAYGINQGRQNMLMGINNTNYGRDMNTYNTGVQQNALMADLYSQAFNQQQNVYNTNNNAQMQNYNVLSGLAGVGQQQLQQNNALSANMASNVGNTMVNRGNAIAQGHINVANANTQMINDLSGYAGTAAGYYQ